MKLQLVHLSDFWWEELKRLHEDRVGGDMQLGRPNHAIVVADGPLRLVAAVCLYPTDGEWVVVEHVVTNALASSAERSSALDIIASVLRDYGCVTGKIPICFPTTDSIADRLKAFGWVASAAPSLVRFPLVDK